MDSDSPTTDFALVSVSYGVGLLCLALALEFLATFVLGYPMWGGEHLLDLAGMLVTVAVSGIFLVYVGVSVAALLTHAVVLILVKNPRGLQCTMDALCYATCPAVVLAVPGLGPWIFWLWGFVLAVRGIAVVHQTTTMRALVVCGVTTAIFSVHCVLFAGSLMYLTAGPILSAAFRVRF